MKNKLTKTTLALLGALIISGSCVAETVERIVAVVGDRIILASELTNQVQLYLLSAGSTSNINTGQIARDILDQIISDELILSAARDDTTITVTEDEIQASLNEHIASLAARFPTEQAFLEQLRQEGLTKRSLEKRYRPDIRDQILKQRIIGQKLSKVSVSRQETEEFFKVNVDSLPDMQGKIKLAHILVKFKVSPQTDDSVKQIAQQARQMALSGADFAQIAEQFSPRVSGAVGGRIGFIRREEVVPEFGRAAFNMQPGSISGVVRTQYGWHIIKSHTRFRDSVDVSQILFPLLPSPADSIRSRTVIDSLYTELQNGSDFKKLAKFNSDDDASRGVGGELEIMTDEQLRPEFINPLQKIEIGQFTPPVVSQLGYHILRLLERETSRPLNMALDFDIIRNFARQQKTSKLVEDWVAELKETVYIDVRDLTVSDASR